MATMIFIHMYEPHIWIIFYSTPIKLLQCSISSFVLDDEQLNFAIKMSIIYSTAFL